MDRITINTTGIAGLHTLQRHPRRDGRGFFERLFCESALQDLLGGNRIAQINHSFTRALGTVRGMHFQYPPDAEKKIICCLQGKIWDVAVDLRRGSPTFLKWHAEELSGENYRAFFIPEGFAHGFQALSGDCSILYLHTAPYSQTGEGALHAQDPRLRINWPMPVSGLSQRDASHPFISEDFDGISP